MNSPNKTEEEGQRKIGLNLPTEIEHDHDGSIRQSLIDLGFEFGDQVTGNPLLTQVKKLPAGWKKVGSDHDMWSYIYDERVRLRIWFYYRDTARYRRAYMSVEPGIV